MNDTIEPNRQIKPAPPLITLNMQHPQIEMTIAIIAINIIIKRQTPNPRMKYLIVSKESKSEA